MKTLNMEGYDVVALAACDHGHVMVLNNNDDHFIVVDTQTEGSLTVETVNEKLAPMHVNPQGTIRKTISYGPGRDYDLMTDALAIALAEMTRVALMFTEEPRDHDPDEHEVDAMMAERAGPEVIDIEEYDKRWVAIMTAFSTGNVTLDQARAAVNDLLKTRRS